MRYSAMREQPKKKGCERRQSRAAVLRRSEQTRFPVWERRRSRRVLDVRAADLQEEMAEQRIIVSPGPTKTAATRRTSQRAERA